MATFLSLVLFLLLISMVLGLIKPSIVKLDSRKKVIKYLGLSLVAVFILLAITVPPSPRSEAVKTPNADLAVQKNQEDPKPAAVQKTPEQTLEDQLKSTVRKIGASEFSYKGIELKDADAGKPKGSKMVTVSVNTGDFWSKDSLIRNTSELTSDIFQKIQESQLPISDYVVWYYGKTKDQFGNEKDDIIMSYASTQDTIKKINWSGFDKNTMCDLLKSQPSDNFDNVCVLKVNIK